MSYLSIEKRAEFRAFRKVADDYIPTIAENTVKINENMKVIRLWKPGKYVMGDVRMYEGIPYKCVQAHDSISNPNWTPDVTPALWMQYHGTSVETARPWLAPAGAHDMYKVGEYMIYTDGLTYECINDTTYSPTEYSQAWEVVTN
jgi:hypothetical protein